MLVNIIKNSDPQCSDGLVRVGRPREVIPAGQMRTVKCAVRTGLLLSSQEALLLPDEHASWPDGLSMSESMMTLSKGTYSCIALPITKNTCHIVTLSPRTVLGQVQLVEAVYPVDALPVTPRPASPVECPEVSRVDEPEPDGKTAEDEERWDPPLTLTHLPLAQQRQVKQMLREECKAFAREDDDVGYIPSLQLKIRLTDTTPVRRTYVSVPKPLHKKVKQYLEDLLNRG